MALTTASKIIEIGFKNEKGIDSEDFPASYIETIELRYIRPYFAQVYDDIVAKISSEYTTNEALLVVKIEKALVLFCKHDIIPELSLKLGAAGVQTYGSEFSNPVSSRERAVLQNVIMGHAETEMDNVIRWYVLQSDLTGEETEVNNDFLGDVVL